MLVPAAVEKLGEAHTAFCHAASEQAVVGVGAGSASVFTIELEHRVGLVRKVRELRCGRLHAEGHFVLADARLDFGVAQFVVAHLIELGEVVEHLASVGAGDAIGVVEK